jgi:hypothetical protein
LHHHHIIKTCILSLYSLYCNNSHFSQNNSTMARTKPQGKKRRVHPRPRPLQNKGRIIGAVVVRFLPLLLLLLPLLHLSLLLPLMLLSRLLAPQELTLHLAFPPHLLLLPLLLLLLPPPHLLPPPITLQLQLPVPPRGEHPRPGLLQKELPPCLALPLHLLMLPLLSLLPLSLILPLQSLCSSHQK